uniref:Uncharacterized protein n=1 Tax=Anguilla anguilla TaxID=7936 RepID=A0A0E9VY99_ANGAN
MRRMRQREVRSQPPDSS